MKRIKEYIRMCIAFEQSKGDFWWGVMCDSGRKDKREIKRLKKILRWKIYRDYDPFEEERAGLLYEIRNLNDQYTQSRKWDIETIEELQKDNAELLEIKDSHYKLIAAIKINES